MNDRDRWLLPAGIHEELPIRARHLERLRAQALCLFQCWGYEFLIPPMVEYLESLLLSDDENLRLQTFKLTDQESGRTMGLRADITPQVARIDACMLTARPINRLCYFGTALTTRAESVYSSRAPMQFGAEIYGHDGKESDLEVIRLMMATLETLGIGKVRLDLGHVGVYAALAKNIPLSRHDEHKVLNILQKKSEHDLRDCMQAIGVDKARQKWFFDLLTLNGQNAQTINKARDLLANTGDGVEQALDELEAVADGLAAVNIYPCYDLAELRGYHYKTGVVFAAFTPGIGQEIIRGGRYNGVGRVFGKARPATGFSGDMKLLASIVPIDDKPETSVFVPFDHSPALREKVEALRAEGQRLIEALRPEDRASDYGCQRRLRRDGAERWAVEDIE